MVIVVMVYEYDRTDFQTISVISAERIMGSTGAAVVGT